MKAIFRHVNNRQLTKRHRVRQNHLNEWLAFLDRQMTEHPELITPVDEEQLKRIAALVEGVELSSNS